MIDVALQGSPLTRSLAASVLHMLRWEREGLPPIPVMSLVGAGKHCIDSHKVRATLIALNEAEMARFPSVSSESCRTPVTSSHWTNPARPPTPSWTLSPRLGAPE